ncbi:UNVERIFIED_CONTAM: hypothetical protein FKN15_077672 [Acipenser sinensis]
MQRIKTLSDKSKEAKKTLSDKSKEVKKTLRDKSKEAKTKKRIEDHPPKFPAGVELLNSRNISMFTK